MLVFIEVFELLVRSLLFVPGNQPNMLDKALTLNPDVYVPDMEDSIPINEKENARGIITSFLYKMASTNTLVIPRINSLDTGFTQKDMDSVIGVHIFGVSVGKIECSQDIKQVCNMIGEVENKNELQSGSIKLLPWIETAKAIVNAYEICVASPRIIGVGFGAEDFTNDMGIDRTEDSSEIAYARSVVSVAARAADVLAIDTPYFALGNLDGLSRDVKQAKKCGFNGKFAIHPEQIPVINEGFSPSRNEVDKAKRIIDAFQEAELHGRGSISLDGMVVDIPVVKRARNILKLATKLNEEY